MRFLLLKASWHIVERSPLKGLEVDYATRTLLRWCIPVRVMVEW